MNLCEIFDLKKNKIKWIYEFNNNTNDYIGINNNIKDLKDWLHSNTRKPGLVVYGPIGCGKTSSCIMSCIEEDIFYYIRDASNKRSKKDLQKYYDGISHFKNCCLIMDDMDIISQGECMSMSDIQKWLKENYQYKNKIKIIFIITDIYLKKVKDISKYCDYIKFDYPKLTDFYLKCKKINKNISKNAVKSIVHFFKFEPRSIFNNLNNRFDIKTLQVKNSEYDMFDSYSEMFSQKSLSEKYRIFNKESGTLPIILQENYYDWNITNMDYVRLSEYMSNADIFHQKMFCCGVNLNNDIYATEAVLLPIQEICDKYTINKIIPKSKPRFGLLWTKQSAMYQKRKFIQSIEKSNYKSPNIDINHLYDIKQDIDNHLSLNNFNKIKEIMNVEKFSDKNVMDLFNLFIFKDDHCDKKKKLKSLLKI